MLRNQAPAGGVAKDRLDRRIKNPGQYLGLDLNLRGKERGSEQGRVWVSGYGYTRWTCKSLSSAWLSGSLSQVGASKARSLAWLPDHCCHTRTHCSPAPEHGSPAPEHTAAQFQNTLQPSSRSPFPWAQGPRQSTMLVLGAITGVSKSRPGEIQAREQSKTALLDDWFHLPLTPKENGSRGRQGLL